MAKIAQVSAKYIVTASILIEGVVDRPDVIGAIFGQTEGLLGADLELRELQRSGRIGRIEVNVNTKTGKSQGEIIIPSSLDKAETAIIGAALEIIERIGPCNAHIRVEKIEDVRVNKRQHVLTRAKELLQNLMDGTIPDSTELAEEVVNSVRVMEITEWGRERLPAGPGVEESDEITIVEGRADVLLLLKHGFKNAIAINGTSMPESIVKLCSEKTVTIFVDGDRGGDLIIKELMGIAEVDFVTKAPDGKEVEELTKKEIHKALRSRIAAEQYKADPALSRTSNDRRDNRNTRDNRNDRSDRRDNNRNPRNDRDNRSSRDDRQESEPRSAPVAKRKAISAKEKEQFNKMLEDLVGTKGGYILDGKLNILGKVPVSELVSSVKSLKTGMHAVIFDGTADRELAETCQKNGVDFLVGMGTKVKGSGSLQILTVEDLE